VAGIATHTLKREGTQNAQNPADARSAQFSATFCVGAKRRSARSAFP